MTRRIKDLMLERYLADAMPADEREAVEKTLRDSPADAARVAELRADSQAFLIQHPPAPFAARVLEQQKKPLWRYLWVPVAAALAAVVAVVALRPSVAPVEPEFGIKGALTLTVHRKTQAGSEVLARGMSLTSGDSIRFEVKTPKPGYVAIVGTEASGRPTVFVPSTGTDALKMERASEVLPEAIELDDSPGPERFTALWSAEPFVLQTVMNALAQGVPLERAVPSVKVVTLEVQKSQDRGPTR